MADLSRRSFLKAGLATAGAVAASTVPAGTARAALEGHLATLMDIRKCIGCEACVDACKESNEDKFPQPDMSKLPKMYPQKRVKISDWSEDQDVMDRLTPYNWLYIQTAEGKYKGKDYSLTIPRRCMHCQNPPCVSLCPFGSAHQQDNGIAMIDADICLGGAKCKSVCPWKIPERQSGVGIYLDILPEFAGNGVMYKCDRCYQKVAQGEAPACIDICPEDVQKIGPRDEIVKEAKAIAEEIGGYIYGLNENGGTNTIYVSPVPFGELNKAVEKGPGKPHLKPVADAMAESNNLVKALAIAPLAGIAGAVGRFVSLAKKSTEAEKDAPKEGTEEQS